MHSTRWSPDHTLPTAAHRGPGSGQSPPGDTREKAMGQQRRRPEAGEGCFNQASQEDVLEEVTTGPPPATFASVRGAAEAKARRQENASHVQETARPAPRALGRGTHGRLFRSADLVRQHARLRTFLPWKTYSPVLTVQTAEVAQTIKASFLLKYERAERCGARGAAGPLFPPVMGRRGAGRAQRDRRGRQGTSGATSPEPRALFWAIKNKAG